jgi:hypothetical protein
MSCTGVRRRKYQTPQQPPPPCGYLTVGPSQPRINRFALTCLFADEDPESHLLSRFTTVHRAAAPLQSGIRKISQTVTRYLAAWLRLSESCR